MLSWQWSGKLQKVCTSHSSQVQSSIKCGVSSQRNLCHFCSARSGAAALQHFLLLWSSHVKVLYCIFFFIRHYPTVYLHLASDIESSPAQMKKIVWVILQNWLICTKSYAKSWLQNGWRKREKICIWTNWNSAEQEFCQSSFIKHSLP